MDENKELTIYDILPRLSKLLLEELEKFIKADEGYFHQWEIAIYLPAINLFIHYLDSVNESLRRGNYVATLTAIRGLIECLTIIVYDGSPGFTKHEYENFLERGRLAKWNDTKGKWRTLTSKELVTNFEKVMTLQVSGMYDQCCDILHFSTKHMGLLNPHAFGISEEHRPNVSMHIGHSDDIPSSIQKELINFCSECCTVLGALIRRGTEEKDRRYQKRKNKE